MWCSAAERTSAAWHTGWRSPLQSTGFVGLAIGRTIWLEALSEHQAGRLEREAAITQIAANYRQMIDVYADAAVSAREHSAHAHTA